MSVYADRPISRDEVLASCSAEAIIDRQTSLARITTLLRRLDGLTHPDRDEAQRFLTHSLDRTIISLYLILTNLSLKFESEQGRSSTLLQKPFFRRSGVEMSNALPQAGRTTRRPVARTNRTSILTSSRNFSPSIKNTSGSCPGQSTCSLPSFGPRSSWTNWDRVLCSIRSMNSANYGRPSTNPCSNISRRPYNS